MFELENSDANDTVVACTTSRKIDSRAEPGDCGDLQFDNFVAKGKQLNDFLNIKTVEALDTALVQAGRMPAGQSSQSPFVAGQADFDDNGWTRSTGHTDGPTVVDWAYTVPLEDVLTALAIPLDVSSDTILADHNAWVTYTQDQSRSNGVDQQQVRDSH